MGGIEIRAGVAAMKAVLGICAILNRLLQVKNEWFWSFRYFLRYFIRRLL